MEAASNPATRARTLPPWPAERPLRAWQEAALAKLLERPSGDFLASATPAAGKTTFGLRAAYELLRRGIVTRVCVVAPTTHICRQWAADAARYGLDLDPGRANADGPEPRRPPRRGRDLRHRGLGSAGARGGRGPAGARW